MFGGVVIVDCIEYFYITKYIFYYIKTKNTKKYNKIR